MLLDLSCGNSWHLINYFPYEVSKRGLCFEIWSKLWNLYCFSCVNVMAWQSIFRKELRLLLIFFLLWFVGGGRGIISSSCSISQIWQTVFLQTFRLLIIFFLLWCGGGGKGRGNGPICVCHTWGISSGGKFQISEKSSNFPENLKHRAFQRTTKWGSLKKILWIVQSLKEQKI